MIRYIKMEPIVIIIITAKLGRIIISKAILT